MGLVERFRDTVRGLIGEEESPTAQAIIDAIVADARTGAETRRAGWLTDHSAIKVDVTELVLAHKPKADAAQALVARKQQELNEAIDAAGALHSRHRLALMDLEWRQGRIEGELRESASPLIAAFREELRAMVPEASDARDVITEINIAQQPVTVWTNTDSIERRIETIRAALRSLDGIELEPLSEAELEARFTDIRDSLPPIEVRPAKYRLGASDAA